MVKFQYPRKTLLTLPPVGVAAPLTCPVTMLESSRIPAIHPSPLGPYREESVGVLGGMAITNLLGRISSQEVFFEWVDGSVCLRWGCSWPQLYQMALVHCPDSSDSDR